jgi:hypothetical protein
VESNTGVGIGLNESWFNANKGGDKRESGGGEFRRKKILVCKFRYVIALRNLTNG